MYSTAFFECYHTIQAVDADTMRGIPCVNFTTVNLISHYTDSNGVIAFFEPGLMNTDIFFTISADGYLYETKDPFGFVGVKLNVSCGKKSVVPVKRLNIAQRLYRVTGEGIYRDSVIVNEPVANISRNLLESKFLINQGVIGQDSVHTIVYKKSYFWIWGDTNRMQYPLGNFQVTGATSALPAPDQLDIENGIVLNYFKGDNGFVKSIAPIEPLSLPTWIHALATGSKKQAEKKSYNEDAEDANSLLEEEELYCTYFKPRADLTILERGMAQWNDEKQQFEKLFSFDEHSVLSYPVDGSHTLRLIDTETGIEYYYFGNPFISTRVPVNEYTNLKAYESYTPLKFGTSAANLSTIEFNKAENGSIIWSWQKDTSPLTTKQLADLVLMGKLNLEDAKWLHLQSATGEKIYIHAGTINWNAYRNKFILIGQQGLGKTSLLGELWYSEAPSILGPWTYAVKIVTHNSIDFYNPMQHVIFDKKGGKEIFFEGTFVVMFDKGVKVPRYDYNQQMYKLDLSDPRLRE